MEMTANHLNPAFIGDDGVESQRTASQQNQNTNSNSNTQPQKTSTSKNNTKNKPRDSWGNSFEFLMSCIALSVGLGNVWRFPFTALENGGGAFLIPYLIVLFLVGKPIYFLEMVIGEFSNRGPAKVYDLCPAMRGVGIGQVIAISFTTTYYLALMGITLYYLVASFSDPLPWSVCQSGWLANCIPAGENDANITKVTSYLRNVTDMKPISSAELYFFKEVLHVKANIDDGLGAPNWQLVVGLFVSCICVVLIIIRGVRSSGKVSYFLALFPYIIMGVLLVRAVTLPGSLNGIIYFIKPDWQKILEPKVWYAAVTQCFFSLSVCFGVVIMYASYNKFGQNIYRDATIVTTLDTCTSLLAGCIIFGIIGHLAHEIGTDNIHDVVKGDTGLAFISYPDAIAKFKQLPQIFAVLFFLMLFILGIGTNIAMVSCTVTMIRDNFPKVKQWQCAVGVATVSFCIALAHTTPGGQFAITLVDFFGSSMIALVLGILELYTLGWVYGTNRLCKDIEFMMDRKMGLYWRLCWSIVTPFIMTVIWIYFVVTAKPLTYNDVPFPNWAYAVGWCLTAFGVLQVPIWFVVAVRKQPQPRLMDRIKSSFRPKANWGPLDQATREQYHKEIEESALSMSGLGFFGAIKKNIFG